MNEPPLDSVRAIAWVDDQLELLDQRQLPERREVLRIADAAAAGSAIADMVVRGAPAIGVTAAYAVVLAARSAYRESQESWRSRMRPVIARLADARPTAVNLAWALRRMMEVADGIDRGDPTPRLLAAAKTIHTEDIQANRRMGALGADLFDARCSVLTHCNTGSLATGGYGTALGVIRSAFHRGMVESVFADETRPWLQGARLTAWELVQDRIPVKLLADGAASFLLSQGAIGWVIVGADRVAANGDVANKIGTYSLAVNARYHGVGFMVVAPTSTIDPQCPDGAAIPIEQRPDEEILSLGTQRVAAAGAGAWNPVFDVTPAPLVDALVTEKGVVMAPDRERIARLLDD